MPLVESDEEGRDDGDNTDGDELPDVNLSATKPVMSSKQSVPSEQPLPSKKLKKGTNAGYCGASLST